MIWDLNVLSVTHLDASGLTVPLSLEAKSSVDAIEVVRYEVGADTVRFGDANKGVKYSFDCTEVDFIKDVDSGELIRCGETLLNHQSVDQISTWTYTQILIYGNGLILLTVMCVALSRRLRGGH